jgi:hypothetical protein
MLGDISWLQTCGERDDECEAVSKYPGGEGVVSKNYCSLKILEPKLDEHPLLERYEFYPVPGSK